MVALYVSSRNTKKKKFNTRPPRLAVVISVLRRPAVKWRMAITNIRPPAAVLVSYFINNVREKSNDPTLEPYFRTEYFSPEIMLIAFHERRDKNPNNVSKIPLRAAAGVRTALNTRQSHNSIVVTFIRIPFHNARHYATRVSKSGKQNPPRTNSNGGVRAR